MTKTYAREEVVRFISQLERKAHKILELAAIAEGGARKASYQSYMSFRDKTGELETFGIIIENRLRALEGGRDAILEDKFDRINILILSGLIRASMKFFMALSEHAALPLGTKEIFAGELRNLHNSCEKLGGERYQEKMSALDLKNLKLADQILMTVIDKAPSLLSLDDED